MSVSLIAPFASLQLPAGFLNYRYANSFACAMRSFLLHVTFTIRWTGRTPVENQLIGHFDLGLRLLRGGLNIQYIFIGLHITLYPLRDAPS